MKLIDHQNNRENHSKNITYQAQSLISNSLPLMRLRSDEIGIFDGIILVLFELFCTQTHSKSFRIIRLTDINNIARYCMDSLTPSFLVIFFFIKLFADKRLVNSNCHLKSTKILNGYKKQFDPIRLLIFYKQLKFILLMSRQKEKSQSPNNNQRQQYVKVNAYTQESSIEQILTVVLFLVQVAMHNIFVTSAIANQDSSILWVMLAVAYILLVLIVGDYFFLTCSDPVDDLLLGINKGYKPTQTKYCKQGCNTLVHKSSYHCHSCDRCVEKFDHHCKYLNNCIGGKNYHSFFRMLVMVTAFCLVIIGQAIWIFVFAQNDESFNSRILSKWGVLATLIYTIIMMISVDTLLCFHLYLVLKLKKTTIEFLDIRTHDYVDSSKDVIEG